MGRPQNCRAVTFPTKAPKVKMTRAQIKAAQKQREDSRRQTMEIVARLSAEDRAREEAEIEMAVRDANAAIAHQIDPEEINALCRRVERRAAT